jgi:hypothetical protein
VILSHDNKRKTDKLNYTEMKRFCASQNTINSVERQPTQREKIFANYTSGKSIISTIYTKDTYSSKTTNQLKVGKET